MTMSFTRSPSTKTQVDIETTGLAQADNTLILIGRKAASGATAPVYTPYQVENFGDPVKAAAELAPLLGNTSELYQMALAAINANFLSGASGVTFPPLKLIPLASTDMTVEPGVTPNLAMPAPFIAAGFDATQATPLADLLAYAQALSTGDRGGNGQFGSFAFMGIVDELSAASPISVATASQNLLMPWLIDSGETPANTPAEMAAAVAAICAGNGYPFMPLTDAVVGGLVPPVASSDWHTAGDTGSEALGLASGLIPLMVGFDGKIHISRTVTTRRVASGDPDTEYFDLQDWQGLYFIGQDFYTLTQQNRYKIAERSVAKVNALVSEFVDHLKQMEKGTDGTNGVVQGVSEAASQIAIDLPSDNRSAAILTVPVDIVPGFYNKGVDLIGTDAFDSATS